MRVNKFASYLKPEDRLHADVVKYIKFKYPSALVHHSPNEGRRGPYQRYLMKCLSVNAGFPDLLIFYRGKILAIELKVGKNKPSPAQRKWISDLDAYMPVKVIYTIDEAIEFIDHNIN